MANFGINLYNLRVKHGYTLESLAHEINKAYGTTYTKSVLSKWENSKSIPAVQRVIPIANFFRVSVDFLLGIDGNREDTDYFVGENTVAEQNKPSIVVDEELAKVLVAYSGLPDDKKKYVFELMEMLGKNEG